MRVIKINDNDNVAVALKPLKKGETVLVSDVNIELSEDVNQGHKFSLVDIEEGSDVVKYGYPIGIAISKISKGSHVHVHNLKTKLNDKLEYSYNPITSTLASEEPTTFMGYLRENGEAGVRNEIWVIPTVGCVNSIVKEVERTSKEFIKDGLEDVIAFNHPYGCSQMGDDQDNTQKALARLIEHPNAGGVVVLGLGCENSSIEQIKKHLTSYDDKRVRFIKAQDEEDEIEACIKAVSELAKICQQDKREKLPVSLLKIGLKCGGSDGLSGITANPVVGKFSDYLIEQGGTTILTEVPEMFGAESILMNRAKDKEVFNQTVKLINDFKEYFISNNQTIYENPSPGNKEGGISTLEDKSLGCTQKSGSAQVVGVLDYAEKVKNKGLNLLSAPGNDLVAASALAFSGCQIVLFTTGRGTPFASVVPTMKISSNTTLAMKKSNWIDFNAGSVVEGLTIDQCGKLLFEEVVSVASGKKVKSEAAGYHDIAIFKKGVTL